LVIFSSGMRARVGKDLEQFDFSGTPINEGPVTLSLGAARLHQQRFFSPQELNVVILVPLDRLNDRGTRQLGASRRYLFDQIERAALCPLPA
jgi:hypothetical protein